MLKSFVSVHVLFYACNSCFIVCSLFLSDQFSYSSIHPSLGKACQSHLAWGSSFHSLVDLIIE